MRFPGTLALTLLAACSSVQQGATTPENLAREIVAAVNAGKTRGDIHHLLPTPAEYREVKRMCETDTTIPRESIRLFFGRKICLYNDPEDAQCARWAATKLLPLRIEDHGGGAEDVRQIKTRLAGEGYDPDRPAYAITKIETSEGPFMVLGSPAAGVREIVMRVWLDLCFGGRRYRETGIVVSVIPIGGRYRIMNITDGR